MSHTRAARRLTLTRATRWRAQILVLATTKYLDIHQEEPYGDLLLHPGERLLV